MKDNTSQSFSRFILPFYYESDEGNTMPFCIPDWERIRINTKYLTPAVYELFRDNDASACKQYRLKDDARSKYGLPNRTSPARLSSQMPACSGEYEFYLSEFRMIYFSTGMGFISIEVLYLEDSIDSITDFSFCFSNIFTNEHDDGVRENNLVFCADDNTFSIKKALQHMLCIENHKENLKLFPSTSRNRLLVYHSVIMNDRLDNENNCIYRLCGALHTKAYRDDKESINTISSFGDQLWGILPNGVVSLAYINGDNRDFLEKIHRRNVRGDYFSIYVLALHERELLLEDNYKAVRNRNNTKKLISMKPHLLEMDILYRFNTVSIEPPYQRFYEELCDKFKLSSLREDISEVIENVERYMNDYKSRKTNMLLSAISILAVFSILIDAISLADRIKNGNPFGIMHWSALAIILIGVCIPIIVSMIRKQ